MIPDSTFTLEKAKAHLRVMHAEEDALITAMLDAAVGAVERMTRRAWTEREWSVPIEPCASCGCDSWVFHALLSPATVEVKDQNDVAIPGAFTSTRYGHTVVHIPALNPPAEFAGDLGTITYTASPPGDYVPPDVYAAVMLYLGDLYENREAQIVGISMTPNPTADALLRSYVIEMHM